MPRQPPHGVRHDRGLDRSTRAARGPASATRRFRGRAPLAADLALRRGLHRGGRGHLRPGIHRPRVHHPTVAAALRARRDRRSDLRGPRHLCHRPPLSPHRGVFAGARRRADTVPAPSLRGHRAGAQSSLLFLRARDLSARPGGDRPAGRRPGDRQCLLRGRLRRLADRDPCGDRVGVRLAGPRDLRVLRHLPRHHADDRAVVAALRRDRARPPQDADLDQAQEQASLPLDLHHRAAAPLPGGDHDAQGRTAGRGAWLRHWRNRDDAAHPLGRGHRLGLPGPGPVDVDPDRVRGLALGGNARERHAQGRRGPPPRPTQRHRNRRVRRPFPRLQLSAAST